METRLIKSQEHLDRLISIYPMLNNVYYIDRITLIPINWEKEFIKMTKIGETITLERIYI